MYLEAIDHILVHRWLPTYDHYPETCRAREKPRIFSRTPEIISRDFTLLNCRVNSGARGGREIHTSRFFILAESKNVGIGWCHKIPWQRRNFGCQTRELPNALFLQPPPYSASDWVGAEKNVIALGYLSWYC